MEHILPSPLVPPDLARLRGIRDPPPKGAVEWFSPSCRRWRRVSSRKGQHRPTPHRESGAPGSHLLLPRHFNPLHCLDVLAGNLKLGNNLFRMVMFLLIIHILLRHFDIQGTVINALGIQDIILCPRGTCMLWFNYILLQSFKRWQESR